MDAESLEFLETQNAAFKRNTFGSRTILAGELVNHADELLASYKEVSELRVLSEKLLRVARVAREEHSKIWKHDERRCPICRAIADIPLDLLDEKRACPECDGSGSVRSYEYVDGVPVALSGAECPRCKGSGLVVEPHG